MLTNNIVLVDRASIGASRVGLAVELGRRWQHDGVEGSAGKAARRCRVCGDPVEHRVLQQRARDDEVDVVAERLNDGRRHAMDMQSVRANRRVRTDRHGGGAGASPEIELGRTDRECALSDTNKCRRVSARVDLRIADHQRRTSHCRRIAENAPVHARECRATQIDAGAIQTCTPVELAIVAPVATISRGIVVMMPMSIPTAYTPGKMRINAGTAPLVATI